MEARSMNKSRLLLLVCMFGASVLLFLHFNPKPMSWGSFGLAVSLAGFSFTIGFIKGRLD